MKNNDKHRQSLERKSPIKQDRGTRERK